MLLAVCYDQSEMEIIVVFFTLKSIYEVERKKI